MKPITLSLPSLLAIAALATGCVHAPTATTLPTPSADHDCRQLGAAMATTQKAMRAAVEKEQNAWKAVVPFAVAARYASGKAAVGEAEKTFAKLQAESNRQGCTSHGN